MDAIKSGDPFEQRFQIIPYRIDVYRHREGFEGGTVPERTGSERNDTAGDRDGFEQGASGERMFADVRNRGGDHIGAVRLTGRILYQLGYSRIEQHTVYGPEMGISALNIDLAQT